jgi:uncharacterized protein
MMEGVRSKNDYVIRLVEDPSTVSPQAWDELVAMQAAPSPFLRHAYLQALHASGSAVQATGWTPQWLLLWRGNELEAACALYLKTHSFGEYVFDWAWADAYERHGLAYYPKLLGAVPFTPVPGSRLLARDQAARLHLLTAVEDLARQHQWSSIHLLFVDEADVQAARSRGWLLRDNLQFHWSNRSPQPYADFDDFLADLRRDKRKKVQQERRRVRDAGVQVQARRAEALQESDWDFFYACYARTYRLHRSSPYLTRSFFTRLAQTQPQHWLMFTAEREGQPIACSLLAVDDAQARAWGRYWGALEDLPCLHFECCYYAPLQWCIAQGYRHFEGGAQGEHKMARGLMPVATHSAHWLAHPQFARAVADFLARESAGVELHVDELRERTPFRTASAEPPPPPPVMA